LQTLIEAVRLRPDIKKQPYAGQLFSQAAQRVTIKQPFR
jgi:hypothetical protein